MDILRDLPVSWVDVLVILMLVVSVQAGMTEGFLRTVFHIVQNVIAIVLSAFLAPVIATGLPDSVGMPLAVSYLAAFLLIRILLGIVVNLLRIVDHIPVLNQVNKFLGGVVGLLRGVVVIWIAMFVIVMLKEVPWCVSVAGEIEASKFLSMIYEWNPLPDLLRNFL